MTPSADKASSARRYADLIHLALAFAVIATVFFWLQFSTPGVCCGDFDGYYHIKWSALLWDGLRHGSFPPTFTWLPLTTLSPSRYADQHFLFHVLLIPFTWMGDLVTGAKIAAAFFGTLALFSVYWLILRYRIAYPLLWLLALLGCSWLFYARLSMTKAESVSLVFIVVGIFLLLERKYVWLAPLAFLYVWAYNLFVLLGVLAAIWVAVVWWSERRLQWRPLLWTALGMLAGFLINPYFPRNLKLFIEHSLAHHHSFRALHGVLASFCGVVCGVCAAGRKHEARVRQRWLREFCFRSTRQRTERKNGAMAYGRYGSLGDAAGCSRGLQPSRRTDDDEARDA
jgi:hypothetical protein